MRAVVQRVTKASVAIDGRQLSAIQTGLLVLLGVAQGDTELDADYLVKKTVGLRVFPDSNGKMNLDVLAIGGDVLTVSQFTLCGDVRKGNRPSFIMAASPEDGKRLYEYYVSKLREIPELGAVLTGQFQADMQVQLVNSGPVTILLDSQRTF